jgi:ankyrin repeat protein
MTSPIHAAAYRDVEILRAVLDAGGDPNLRNDFGETPLMGAIDMRDLAGARLLVERGADVNAADLEPLLAMAAARRRYAAVRFLIKAGADLDTGGRRALVLASGQHADVEMARLLVYLGVEPYLGYPPGLRPVDFARRRKDAIGDEIVKVLRRE